MCSDIPFPGEPPLQACKPTTVTGPVSQLWTDHNVKSSHNKSPAHQLVKKELTIYLSSSRNICILIGYLVIRYYILSKWIHLLKRVYRGHRMSSTAAGQLENYFRTQERFFPECFKAVFLNVSNHTLEIATLLIQ